ncbi:MAG: universal stress protein [Burkholderiaceae bacterium]|nr:universal stress protein [Burkholderiaceae bacterium]MDO9088771.1 universal stress protein [Burkholderiaceae bacterium]MDP1968901.1 universal stress protein [Burkholderiaceae bacterium]
MYQRILVATDGSTLSKKAQRSAIDLAAAVGAELVALYVVPRYPVSYFEGSITVSPQEVARTEKQWAEKGQSVVDALKTAAESRGVKTKAVVARSDLVAESIISASKKHKCDLIVMASHGRKGLSRVLLGSETQHVLTHGSTPVLVLR